MIHKSALIPLFQNLLSIPVKFVWFYFVSREILDSTGTVYLVEDDEVIAGPFPKEYTFTVTKRDTDETLPTVKVRKIYTIVTKQESQISYFNYSVNLIQ